MDPDMAMAAAATMMREAGGPSTSGDFAPQNNPPPTRIVSFNDAVAALRQHTFKNTTDFQTAFHAARSIHQDTFVTINNADISNLQAARGLLHHSDDFLLYISLLHASLAAIEPDSSLRGELIAEYRQIISGTPREWVSAVPQRWVGVNRHAARLAIETHDVQLAISLIVSLREAAAKLAPGPDYLVPIHADFLAVCLEAKCYKLAAGWIRRHRRLRVDVENTALTGTDVHLIHHYSAMVFIGVKDYRAALQSCRLALTVPAPSPGPFHEVVVSTFKLFVLLHLLVTGDGPPNLKFSSYQPPRLRKSVTEAMELASAYEKRDMIQMRQVFQSNRDYFEKQGTLGLVKQVMNSVSKEIIVQLTKSFVTMNMADVACRAGLTDEDEAHTAIVELLGSGRINASINERTGVVRFLENDTAIEERIANELSSNHMDDCVNIVQRVEAFREGMELDPNFLQEWPQNRGRRTNPGSPPYPGANHRLVGFDAEFFR